MSNHNYYQNNPQSYPPIELPATLRPGVSQQSSYAPSVAPSVAPSYHSNDPYESNSKPSNPYSDNKPVDPYANARPPKPYYENKPLPFFGDEIPMKSTSQLSIPSDSRQAQNVSYPPSPESQIPNEALLPKRRSRKKKKGFFSGKVPWFVYIMTLIQCTVFIVEIIKNSIITGSPIMIKPQFNPMIGPSIYVQINMGARFVPCMRTTPGIQDVQPPRAWTCPNSTTTLASDPSNQCTLAELCGLGGLNYENPNQWYRFITPMFLHAGVIHIGFNMLLQMTMGRDMEKCIGTVRFALVYISSGIFGFVLGGNYAATGIASTGASGCLFGILAIVLLDLLYTWKERRKPKVELAWLMFDVLFSFVLGLLPGLDNFSHIGGFLMGLAAGMVILHSPNLLRERIKEDNYRHVGSEPDITLASGAINSSSDTQKGPSSTTVPAKPADLTRFAKEPVGFFKGRKPLWWAWWLIRAGALLGVLIAFIVLINTFYNYRDTCHWCKYLSCLDIKVNGQNWCDLGNLQLNNSTSNSKRDLERVFTAAGVVLGSPVQIK